jgi:hypothetical protein
MAKIMDDSENESKFPSSPLSSPPLTSPLPLSCELRFNSLAEKAKAVYDSALWNGAYFDYDSRSLSVTAVPSNPALPSLSPNSCLAPTLITTASWQTCLLANGTPLSVTSLGSVLPSPPFLLLLLRAPYPSPLSLSPLQYHRRRRSRPC